MSAAAVRDPGTATGPDMRGREAPFPTNDRHHDAGHCRRRAFQARGAIAAPAMQTMNSAFRAVLSPCIGVCMLDDEGLCMGCYRSSGEIARWLQMGDDERLHLMETVLPQREARRRT